MIVRNSPFPSQVNQVNLPSDNKISNDKKEVAPTSTQDSQTKAVAQGDKVDNIKQQIDNGTYKIDINKTADKMAQDLLLDIRVYRDSRDSQ